MTNNGQGTQSGYYSIPLLDIPYIVPTANYKFIATGDYLKNESYVRITDPNEYTTILVGGLRLKEKTIHDGFDSNKDIKYTYDYDKFGFPNVSSGVFTSGF